MPPVRDRTESLWASHRQDLALIAPTAHVLSLSQCPVGAPIFTCAPLQSVPHPAARGAFGKCHLLAINLPVSSQPLNKIANPSTVVFGDPRLHLSDFIPSQSPHHPHSTHPTDPGLLSAPQIHEAPPQLRALHELATVLGKSWHPVFAWLLPCCHAENSTKTAFRSYLSRSWNLKQPSPFIPHHVITLVFLFFFFPNFKLFTLYWSIAD